MKSRYPLFWLIAGIGSIALILGFMVGGSESSVVGVTVPAVFGMVITALGILSVSGMEKKLDDLKDKLQTTPNPVLVTLLRSISDEIKVMPQRTGKVLVVFAVLYGLGLWVGVKARMDLSFASTPERPQFPWSRSGYAPPTTTDAIGWISLQEQLSDLGYTQEQVDHIYSIQVSEWKKAAQPNADSVKSSSHSEQNEARMLELLKAQMSGAWLKGYSLIRRLSERGRRTE